MGRAWDVSDLCALQEILLLIFHLIRRGVPPRHLPLKGKVTGAEIAFQIRQEHLPLEGKVAPQVTDEVEYRLRTFIKEILLYLHDWDTPRAQATLCGTSMFRRIRGR